MEKAVFGANGFFSLEAFITGFRGIEDVQIGQLKGTNLEIVEIWYNPWKVSYQELLELFFDLHDPTSGDSQSCDNQSYIFFSNKQQYTLAKQKKRELKEILKNQLITKITPAYERTNGQKKFKLIS